MTATGMVVLPSVVVLVAQDLEWQFLLPGRLVFFLLLLLLFCFLLFAFRLLLAPREWLDFLPVVLLSGR